MLQEILNKIKNLFKVGSVTIVDDTGNFQTVKLTFLGKLQQALSFKPYGLISNPPPGSMAIVFNQNAQESNLISIIDDPKNRPKNLLPGESGLANYITANTFILKTNGIAELTTAVLNVTGDINSATNISGVNITGTGTISAPIIIVGVVNLGTHVHDNGTGTGTPTGPPV